MYSLRWVTEAFQFLSNDSRFMSQPRYLDSVTNKDSTLPPIPHLHSLLSDDVGPYPAVDIFRLIGTSYEVGVLPSRG